MSNVGADLPIGRCLVGERWEGAFAVRAKINFKTIIPEKFVENRCQAIAAIHISFCMSEINLQLPTTPW
jgi:hypothetical protein